MVIASGNHDSTLTSRCCATAGVVVLEELEHARARGAPILAEFLGGSFTSDAYHLTDPRPDGAGVSRCIQQVSAAADLLPHTLPPARRLLRPGLSLS